MHVRIQALSVVKVVCINRDGLKRCLKDRRRAAVGYWRGSNDPLPSDRGLGERCQLPQRGSGRSSGRRWFWCIHVGASEITNFNNDVAFLLGMTVFGQVGLKSQQGRAQAKAGGSEPTP